MPQVPSLKARDGLPSAAAELGANGARVEVVGRGDERRRVFEEADRPRENELAAVEPSRDAGVRAFGRAVDGGGRTEKIDAIRFGDGQNPKGGRLRRP
jgi:hypothetical protein